ncbi:MAG: hypothetical protein LBT38_07410 [Deltaproteobacteria bacterium]|jgi:G:T/U-mismatch repair DNA glycosylase|nr:hypothetical protein [Deltaproteobacteria bacterium]
MGNDENKPDSLYKFPFEFIGKSVTSNFLSEVLTNIVEVPSNLAVTRIGQDLPNVPYSMPRADNIFLLSDDSFLILEFQSDFRYQDLIRFLKYGVFLVDNAWQRDTIKRPVRIAVLYPAKLTLPTSTFSVNGSINISLEHISLGDKIDGVALIDTLKDKLEEYPNLKGEPLLTNKEHASLYLAPFGHISIPNNQFWEDYLTVGAQLTKILDNKNILATMLVAIPNSDARDHFTKELYNMSSDTFITYLDELSGGKISQVQKDLAASKAMNEANKATIAADKATIAASKAMNEADKAMLQAKDAMIMALQQKERSSVLNLFAKGNTVKEISDTLNISEMEVTEIIKNNGTY